jgi:hypothetical protein
MSNEQGDGGVYQMTPEQKANLKRFGKKNGLSEQQVQTQLSSQKQQPQPVAKPQPQVVPATEKKPVAQTTRQPIAQPIAQNVQQQIVQPIYEECQTYFSYQDDEGGNLEVDLITFREKGVETRYLSMVFSGLDVRQDPPSPQTAFLNIESREEFERIKAFFAQLDWED